VRSNSIGVYNFIVTLRICVSGIFRKLTYNDRISGPTVKIHDDCTININLEKNLLFQQFFLVTK